MWTFHHSSGVSPNIIHASIRDSSNRLSFHDVIELWRSSNEFRAGWTNFLASIPFEAYFWETPPLTVSNANQPFECVFVESQTLARQKGDSQSFAQHFRENQLAVTFKNLGGDAILVVPCQQDIKSDFTHLARFVRTSSAEQASHFWKAVGDAGADRMSDQPVWISTAGLGVTWLHVRLDSTPKYYRYEPYKKLKT